MVSRRRKAFPPIAIITDNPSKCYIIAEAFPRTPRAIQPSPPGPSRVQMSAKKNREKKPEEIPVRLVPSTIIAQRSSTSRSRMQTRTLSHRCCVQWRVRCHANEFPTHNANFLPGERLARPELFTGRDRNCPLVIGSESRAI